MTAAQLPGFGWIDNAAGLSATGYATAGPSMICLHMTVSMALSASYVGRHPYPPHCWANPYTGDRWQTVDLNLAAKALYQDPWAAWANRHGWCIQTELVGVPVVDQATYTDAQLRWIAEGVVVPQARYLASIGRPVDLSQVAYHASSGGSASVDWPGRMTNAQWDGFNGLCAHIDVPGNDHWDCSVERLDVIARYARDILGTSPTPTPTPLPEESDVRLFRITDEDGSLYLGEGSTLYGPFGGYGFNTVRKAAEPDVLARYPDFGQRIDKVSLSQAYRIVSLGFDDANDNPADDR